METVYGLRSQRVWVSGSSCARSTDVSNYHPTRDNRGGSGRVLYPKAETASKGGRKKESEKDPTLISDLDYTLATSIFVVLTFWVTIGHTAKGLLQEKHRQRQREGGISGLHAT